MATLSYAQAGVDRQVADHFVEKIAMLSRSTLNRRVKSAIGGYASLFELDKKRWIAASTDGVGTKLKLAFRLHEHRTVGIDLVAMSVNDLLCVGAPPLFFLDYFATGKLIPGVAEQVLEGIVEGCKQASCPLVGGETAEMPDLYSKGEYDLAGFAVGMVDASSVLPRKGIQKGDVLVGMMSSGCHSNGFSLLRKVLADGEEGDAMARELLTPTRIYVSAIKPLLEAKLVKGIAHITGSGFLNVPRMSDQVSYEIQLPSEAERPSVFQWIDAQTGLTLEEQAQTFNLGIGMVLAVSPKNVSTVLRRLKQKGEKAWALGEVIPCRPGLSSQVILRNGEKSVTLNY